MGVVKREDIIAAWVGPEGSELVCQDHLRDGDVIESIVTQDDIDNNDELYFCDRCDKRIV